MKKRKIIHHIIAGVLLAVFALAITPKKTLHNWVASHTDVPYKSGDNKTPQLHKAGFNCQTDNLVAESNFIGSNCEIFPSAKPVNLYLSHYKISFVSVFSLFINLRGPPQF